MLFSVTCACMVWRLKTKSVFSLVRLFVALLTVASQPPLFMGFSRQEYWVGCMPFSWESSLFRDRTHISQVSCSGRRILSHYCHLESLHLFYSDSQISSLLFSFCAVTASFHVFTFSHRVPKSVLEPQPDSRIGKYSHEKWESWHHIREILYFNICAPLDAVVYADIWCFKIIVIIIYFAFFNPFGGSVDLPETSWSFSSFLDREVWTVLCWPYFCWLSSCLPFQWFTPLYLPMPYYSPLTFKSVAYSLPWWWLSNL